MKKQKSQSTPKSSEVDVEENRRKVLSRIVPVLAGEIVEDARNMRPEMGNKHEYAKVAFEICLEISGGACGTKAVPEISTDIRKELADRVAESAFKRSKRART